MALISNGIRLTCNPMQHRVSVALAYGIEKSASNRPGSIRNFYAGEATVISGASIANTRGFPSRNLHHTAWVMPTKSGGVPAANLVAAVTGLGELTATGSLIVSAIAALTGSGDITATMIGSLAAEAALSGLGSLAADLGALADIVANLTGEGGASGTIRATGTLEADINVTGDLLTTANIADSVWGSLAESGYTYAEVVRILASVAAGKTTITGSDVVFRDLGDTKDRIAASMTGSERTSVTLDGT